MNELMHESMSVFKRKRWINKTIQPNQIRYKLNEHKESRKSAKQTYQMTAARF